MGLWSGAGRRSDHGMEEPEGGCWRRQSGAACTEEQVGCSSKITRFYKEGDCSRETCDTGFTGTSLGLSRLGQNKSENIGRHP